MAKGRGKDENVERIRRAGLSLNSIGPSLQVLARAARGTADTEGPEGEVLHEGLAGLAEALGERAERVMEVFNHLTLGHAL